MPHTREKIAINTLHILNDGFKASLLLFLPFIARDLNISLTKVGFLGTAINSLEIFLAIPAGMIAAYVGGFQFLIITMLFYGLGYLLLSASFTYVTVIAAFILAGVAFGMFHPVAFSVVSKMFGKGERGSQLGNFTALGDLGRIGISSLTTFVITYIGWRQTAFFSFTLVIGLFILFYLLFSYQKRGVQKVDQEAQGPGPSYREILKNKRFMLATSCFILDSFASSALFIFIPFLLLQRGVAPIYLGALTSTFFIGNMFGKVLLGKLVDRLGNVRVFIISEYLMAFFIIVLAVSANIPLIILSSIILGAFTKGTVPVLTSMVTEAVDHHGRYEKAFSLNAVFVGIGSTIAPLFLGFLSDTFGITNAFYAASVLAVIATVPAILYRRESLSLQ
ncbi:MAG: MFS transporter [Microgenomates group bacterium]